jgi:drug/metabolite transporter (DMT)-like permease
MGRSRLLGLTALAMLAFAGNSVLCRLALRETGIDPMSFTTVRLASGAVVLWTIAHARRQGTAQGDGNWGSAMALFAYAAAFSWGYVSLPAAVGALLLFGAVQSSMIAVGLWRGERLSRRQSAGLLAACSGLVALLLPGLSTPPLGGAMLMLLAGVSWGIYSLRGQGAGDPVRVSAGNFWRAAALRCHRATECAGHHCLGRCDLAARSGDPALGLDGHCCVGRHCAGHLAVAPGTTTLSLGLGLTWGPDLR